MLDTQSFFRYSCRMHVAQREFTDEILDRIVQTVRDTADLTRCALSRLVCEWLNWKDAAGRAKQSSCRALLVKLERRGLIELPPARPVSFEGGEPAAATVEQQWPQLKTTLQRLGGIEYGGGQRQPCALAGMASDDEGAPPAGRQSTPLPTAFAIASLILGGYPIVKSAIKALLIPDLNVDTLVSIAAISATIVQAYQEAATVIFIMLLGEFLEHLTVGKTRQAIASLIQLSPKTAWVRREDKEVQVPIEEVKSREVVIVKPGERVPVDGKIISGCGSINQSMLTGESILVEKGVGDRVYCGTINESGSCEIETTQIAEDTKLSQIKRLILEAQAEMSPTQRVMDRFARYFIPAILLIAFATFLITGDPIRAITILIVACPCALVLGTPTAVVAAIGNAARQGILIKGGVFLEQMGRLKTLLMDKTGTLTHGRPKVVEIKVFDGMDEKEVLYWAAIGEKRPPSRSRPPCQRHQH